jgi:CubicO group peptidase (beta-lactamase class C family)
MRLLLFLLVSFANFVLWTSSSRAQTENAPALAAILKPIRVKYHLPALAGAIFTRDGVVAMAAVGVRKAGTDIPVTTNDLWHLGSDTKAMTAMLVGTFVAEKKLSWKSKVISFFPEIAQQVPAKIQNITIGQVLSHEAGLAAADESRFMTKLSPSGSIIEQRLKVAHMALLSPEFQPGTFHYSNYDYVVIAAILEKIGGKSWEDVMDERIFRPLRMTQAGFGGAGTVGQVDQPWPHFESGQPAPINGPTMDLPAIWWPAGGVHCTMDDWSRFLIDQLRGGSGMKALLPRDIYQAMQTAAPHSESGYGWGVTFNQPWAGGKVLEHEGSNGMNYCLCLLAPAEKFGVLVCINQGGDKMHQPCNDAASAMISLYAAKLKQP